MNQELEKLLSAKGRLSLPAILIASAECSPLSKVGGLADVAGALPKSLGRLGFDARVITPYHRCIKEKYAHRVEHIAEFYVNLGWRSQYAGLEKLMLDGLCIYLIDSEYFFGDKIYRGGMAEGEQYAFFQRAVLEAIPFMDFQPEVLHCNDWHTAFLPFLLKSQYAHRPQGRLKTLFSIHNIAFQGCFGFDFVADYLGVDSVWYNHFHIQHQGCVNWMKSACVYADKLNTVSPSYAQEIKTPAFGMGMQEPLIYRGADLSGIINGLDTDVFNPETDPKLPRGYNAENPHGKKLCKQALIEELGLDIDPHTPIIAMVTRMTAQKGFDILLPALEGILDLGAAFVLLGTGDPGYEIAMRDAEKRHPGRVCAYLAYSEDLANRIYAGADFLLMPSAFEPCGLSQLIAMRYGTLPIVHEVGGLKDTVQPYNQFTGEGTGFSFWEYSSHALYESVKYALSVCSDPGIHAKLMYQAMSRDFSFAPSALEYARLYISVLEDQGGEIYHDPFDHVCRKPLGALTCGQTVKLFVKAPAAKGLSLIMEGREIAMQREEDGFSALFTAPDSPCVLWYCFRLPSGLYYGPEGLRRADCGAWQLTVYAPDFKTPDWAKGAVMYQIFPDRFAPGGKSAQRGLDYHRGLGREVEYHADWSENVKWQGRDGKFYCPNDFYGGTLRGIISRLDYLAGLGVDVIYLNPIFEADSNHRYNTADYKKIDPILGTLADFKALCAGCEKRGMRIILDGVFSHTGDDSIYFNKYSRYESLGAYQSCESPYRSWYKFEPRSGKYSCWWNFESLPEVNELDPLWQKAIVSGHHSVVRTWLRRGAAGWRLDVADELPDEVIELIRSCARETDPDCLILGEVWEDATTKQSYGQNRRYALGRGLDSVMNYPLKNALIDFVLGHTDAHGLKHFLLSQKLNYPAPMYNVLMNLLGSHDSARIRSHLGLGHDGSGSDRAQQAQLSLSPEQNLRAAALQRLCAALIFALPGMPCIYYGDEHGMQGLRDPFCRGPFTPQEPETEDFYRRLSTLRRENPALKTGDAAFAAPEKDCLAVLRFDGENLWLCCANRSAEAKRLRLRAEDFSGAEPAVFCGKFDAQEVYLEPWGISFAPIK